MKKYWKAIGLVALAAGILYYPAMRIYKAVAARKAANDNDDNAAANKLFSPSYLGKSDHKPHHRKALADGNMR